MSRKLDALVAERVVHEVEAYAPCGDGLTRTDRFAAPTLAECDAAIRNAYARKVDSGMRLWPAEYVGPRYRDDMNAALGALETAGWRHVTTLYDGEAWYVRVHWAHGVHANPATALCIALLRAAGVPEAEITAAMEEGS